MGPTVLMPKRCSSCPAHTAVTEHVATVMGPSGPIHPKRLPASTEHPAHCHSSMSPQMETLYPHKTSAERCRLHQEMVALQIL